MTWTRDAYPDSMKNLDEKTRNKAIEIANTLLEDENYSENRAIPIAISQAKEFVSKRRDLQEDEGAIYLLPKDDKWILKKEKADRASRVFDNKEDGLAEGRKIAKNQNLRFIVQRQDGTIENNIVP